MGNHDLPDLGTGALFWEPFRASTNFSPFGWPKPLCAKDFSASEANVLRYLVAFSLGAEGVGEGGEY